MRASLRLLIRKPYLLMLMFILAMPALPACQKNTCPANSGGRVEKNNRKWKFKRHKKPKSGLWDKKMKM